MLDIQQLETWLWDAACVIRGPVDAPKFKDYILPLIFLKRLSDVYDDEITRLAEEFGSRLTAERLAAEQRGLVRFYVPQEARWEKILQQTIGVGQYLTDEHVQTLAQVYHAWRAEDGLSAVITKEEAARNDYNLSPSRYVATNDKEEVLPLEEAMVLLRETEEERAQADRELTRILNRMGLEDSHAPQA